MTILGKILVPIDINIDSTKQINNAIKIAKAYKSKIILMYIVPDTDLKEGIKQIIKKSATELLNKVKDTFEAQGIEVEEPIIKFGNIVKTIIKNADSLEANLVLIGENEESKRDKYKLSAKSEQILQALDVPVFLVSQNTTSLLTNILCPVDFSDPCKRALSNAILLADTFDAHLTILYVYEPIVYVSKNINVNLEEENELRLERANDEMKAFIKEFDLKDIKHTIEIKSGNANEKILDIIKDQHIDLLIMGTNGRTGLSGFIMGNVTQKVVREIPCSFITVKKISVIGTSKVSYK